MDTNKHDAAPAAGTPLEWPMMPLMGRTGSDFDHEWHVAINRYTEDKHGDDWPSWMYDAKTMAQEVPRLALLFEKERTGTLCKTFRRCSCCSEQKHVIDNHLTCALGKKCRECPILAGLDKAELHPEQRDWIKAWTCAGHIMANGGDRAGTGFIMTVDDFMFWDSVHESMAMAYGGSDDDEPAPEFYAPPSLPLLFTPS